MDVCVEFAEPDRLAKWAEQKVMTKDFLIDLSITLLRQRVAAADEDASPPGFLCNNCIYHEHEKGTDCTRR